MRVLSAPSTGTAVLRGDGDTGRRGRLGDRGQVAVEFLGMLPLIAAVCVILWQSALLGYTYILAGDAADSAAREGAVGLAGQAQCQAAARRTSAPGAKGPRSPAAPPRAGCTRPRWS
ncbi:TadE/TadG family type IV pilus assembly protein [Streptomyces zhihengii]